MSFRNLPLTLSQKIASCSLLKVISGLNNFDQQSVTRIAKAAGLGGADLIDVACDPHLVRLAIKASGLPICVSSVEPELFVEAVRAGASMIEIGNFDSFYPQGRFFNAREVLDLAIQSKKLIKDIPLSVTVPHLLPLDQQAQLAIDLVDVGADIIQTEGSVKATPKNPGVLGLIEKAAPTLAAVQTIFKSFSECQIEVPLICASGLSEATVGMAFASGASGVGVGSVVNRLDSELEMIAMVKNLRTAIDASDRVLNETF